MVGLATKGTFIPPHVELFYQTLCKTPSGRRAQTEGLEAITQWVGIGDTATLEDKPLPQGLQRKVSDRLTEEVSKRAKGNPNSGDAREVCNLFTRYIVRPQ